MFWTYLIGSEESAIGNIFVFIETRDMIDVYSAVAAYIFYIFCYILTLHLMDFHAAE